MVDAIEKRLGDGQWLAGQLPGAADREEFEKLDKTPNAQSHPNTFAWFCLVSKFAESIRAGWTGGSAPTAGGKADAGEAKGKGKKDKKGGKKGKEPAKAEAADEFDPFADDGEEDDGVSRK